MKNYISIRTMFTRPHKILRQFAATFLFAIAAACTQSTFAQQPSEVGQWEGSHPWDFKAIHASLMPEGQILTWEFSGDSAHLWNPITEDFTCMGLIDTVIFCSGHTSLADGSLLVAGGGPHLNLTDETFIYRYGTIIGGNGPWETGPTMEYVRFYPTCTTLSDGRILVVSGSDENGENVDFPEVYDPDISPAAWETWGDADRTLPLYPYMLQLLGGDVFFAGPGKDTLILDIFNKEWLEDPGDIIDAGNEAVDGTAVMYEPGKVLRISGKTGGNIETIVKYIDLTDLGNQPSAGVQDHH